MKHKKETSYRYEVVMRKEDVFPKNEVVFEANRKAARRFTKSLVARDIVSALDDWIIGERDSLERGSFIQLVNGEKLETPFTKGEEDRCRGRIEAMRYISELVGETLPDLYMEEEENVT